MNGRKKWKEHGGLLKLNPIITYSLDSYSEIISNKIKNVEDYWYSWDNDYEPIRVIYKKNIINRTLHRIHWNHRVVKNPYLTNKKIEVFFPPNWHTPMIRKSESDVAFYIAINIPPAPTRIENHDVVIDKQVPEYYTSAGNKGEHLPIVNYNGWPSLYEDAKHQRIIDLISNIIKGTISLIKEKLGIDQ